MNEKLNRLPLSYFDKHAHGDTLSRVVNDIDNINNALEQAVMQVLTSVITIVGILIMMLFISPLLTLVVVVVLPLSFLVIGGVSSFSQKHFVQQQNELGKLNGHIEEMFSGHQVVKVYGYEEKALGKFEEINERLYKAGWKAQFISGLMMPLMVLMNNLSFVVISISGGLMVLNGSIRIGDVQAFIQYSQEISYPLTEATSVASMLQSALASAERIFQLLDEEEELKEEVSTVETNKLRGDVQFKHVRFGYEREKPVIKDVNISVKEGQTVAIVGPTGAGKTTIINLLMRFYESDGGSIHVGGLNLKELNREKARSMFAMVLQDTWLFQGTIRENIAYGKKNASEAEIIAAAKKAYADDFIRKLPEGYDTLLTEDAGNISQGQKQLLTIARAILADPKILILDEATSNVDTRTEMNIQQAMTEMMRNRTSFVIAHRLSTIREADLILVMNQGDIIEQGNHQELLAQNGFYAELYNSQFNQAEAIG